MIFTSIFPQTLGLTTDQPQRGSAILSTATALVIIAEGGAKISAPFIYIKYSKEASMDVPCRTWINAKIFETPTNVRKFDSLALPIPITLVSEQTFDERQLFNLVAAYLRLHHDPKRN